MFFQKPTDKSLLWNPLYWIIKYKTVYAYSLLSILVYVKCETTEYYMETSVAFLQSGSLYQTELSNSLFKKIWFSEISTLIEVDCLLSDTVELRAQSQTRKNWIFTNEYGCLFVVHRDIRILC